MGSDTANWYGRGWMTDHGERPEPDILLRKREVELFGRPTATALAELGAYAKVAVESVAVPIEARRRVAVDVGEVLLKAGWPLRRAARIVRAVAEAFAIDAENDLAAIRNISEPRGPKHDPEWPPERRDALMKEIYDAQRLTPGLGLQEAAKRIQANYGVVTADDADRFFHRVSRLDSAWAEATGGFFEWAEAEVPSVSNSEGD